MRDKTQRLVERLGDKKAVKRIAMQGRQICYPQDVFRLDLEQVETRLFKKLHRIRTCNPAPSRRRPNADLMAISQRLHIDTQT